MAKMYVNEPIKLEAGDGNLFVDIAGNEFVIPWSVVFPALREVNRMAAEFRAENQGKVTPIRAACF